ncbi:MAG: hypothetical protein MJ231_00910 [bacterium]|nr:hypothetical protein [bacterium]
MAFNFKKNIVVGISVNPERGLELAQVDFDAQRVLKYGFRQLSYDVNRKQIADLDLFKEAVSDLLFEQQIPKGSDIVLNLPSVWFKVNDYPAALDNVQVNSAIEEELAESTVFEQDDPCFSAVYLPNSTIQFNKIACTALQKTMLIEVVMQIQELGYNVVNIDTSVNSTLNSLIYSNHVDIDPTKNWVLLLVDTNSCKVIPMQGRNYVDYYEERIAIGEVLGDDENYSTVVEAVAPLLKNLPAEYLYVVSKTDVINAEVLSGKLKYNAPIVHLNANSYAAEPVIAVDSLIDASLASTISLDVIGAAINTSFAQYSSAKFNLFNADLGDVYTSTQPPVFKFRSLEFVMSVENMIVVSFIFAAIFCVIIFALVVFINQSIKTQEENVANIDQEIQKEEIFLEQNKGVSTELFNEGDEINIGLAQNKNVYSYYTIVGTEIPKKLWLTRLVFGEHTVIEGQADNLESVYGFYRNIKDYDSDSKIKLQKLGLASSSKLTNINAEEKFDTDSILTSLNADYYQFRISDIEKDPVPVKKDEKDGTTDGSVLPSNLEPIE